MVESKKEREEKKAKRGDKSQIDILLKTQQDIDEIMAYEKIPSQRKNEFLNKLLSEAVDAKLKDAKRKQLQRLKAELGEGDEPTAGKDAG